jgi:radical SAM superfamily enzyme YgiQ (UPF0313 family)
MIRIQTGRIFKSLIGRNGTNGRNGSHAGPKRASGAFRRVLLVNPPMESMGAEFMLEDIPIRLEYLAAFIRPHVDEVTIVDLTRDKRPLAVFLAEFQPDLVGITANYISTHRNAQTLAAEAKRFGARVVVGGYQVTALPAEFAACPEIDFVVRGEGEQTLLEIVQGKPREQIPGLSFFDGARVVHNPDRPLLADLDELPFPERDRRLKPYSLTFMDLESDLSTGYDMIITSRGCWGRCKFCTEPMMSKGKQRYRKPDKVIEEMAEIVALHRGKKRLRISISDPNFGGNVKVAEEICDRLIEFRKDCPIDLHFFISVRTNTIANHPRLVDKMIQAGIDYVFVGMESPKRQDLKAISKGTESQEKQERAVRSLIEKGASVMSCFLLGLPGQTEQDIWDMVDYAKRLGLEDCYFSVMTPLPGSKLYAEMKAAGKLLETDFTKYKLFDIVFEHDTLSRAKVRELCVRANAKWYDDLLLRQEQRRFVSNGHKPRKLYTYANKFRVLAEFFTFIGANAGEEFADLDPTVFFRDMPNPRLREFTEQHGMHEYLDMRRFLRILGKQKVQVSLNTGNGNTVSWVLKTRKAGVEYLDAIHGTATGASIAINVPMNNGGLTPKKFVQGVLRDNPDWRSRVAILRLLTAAGSEVLSALVDHGVESLRTKLTSRAAAKPHRPVKSSPFTSQPH